MMETTLRSEGAIFEDDELANVFGTFSFSLVAARVTRSLWLLRAWPSPFRKMLHRGFVDGQMVLNDFREDFEAFDAVSQFARPPKALKIILARSVFHLVATQQWLAGCKQLGWMYVQDLKELAAKVFHGVFTSQVIEDLFAMMKNHGQVRGSRRMRKPEACVGVGLTSGALDSRHRYTVVPSDVPVFRRSLRLAKHCFRGQNVPESSLDLGGISSTTSAASWHSPRAEDIGITATDLTTLRF